jgi:glutathione S-transferase
MAAQAHEAQARQRRDRQMVEALRTVYRVLEPTWLRYGPRLLGADATLADVLLVAPRSKPS